VGGKIGGISTRHSETYGIISAYHCGPFNFTALRQPPLALAHLPQFAVGNGKNFVYGYQKPLGYQPSFFENQM
jgi:hypothetical protein